MGLKDFRKGWAELFREISGNTLKEQHMHSGSHLKGVTSKQVEAKEERIYQGEKKKKKSPKQKGGKKKRPRGKTMTREVLRTKKLSKYVKYY